MKQESEKVTQDVHTEQPRQTAPTPLEAYVKPEIEVIELEVEQPILQGSGSNWGNGGRW